MIKRCFKNFNAVDLIHEVKHIQWFDVYMTENEGFAVELLTEKNSKVLDRMAPIKKNSMSKEMCTLDF